VQRKDNKINALEAKVKELTEKIDSLENQALKPEKK
jgi:peptidoglycan hydrolase CwlO-like protein